MMAVEAVVSAAATTDVQITSSTFSRLYGFTITETAGAVATGVIRNGTSTGGAPIAFFSLAIAGYAFAWFGPQGIAAPLGIFLDRVTGTTQCVIYVG